MIMQSYMILFSSLLLSVSGNDVITQYTDNEGTTCTAQQYITMWDKETHCEQNGITTSTLHGWVEPNTYTRINYNSFVRHL